MQFAKGRRAVEASMMKMVLNPLERETHEAGSHGMAAIPAERGELGLTPLDYLLAAQHFKIPNDSR